MPSALLVLGMQVENKESEKIIDHVNQAITEFDFIFICQDFYKAKNKYPKMSSRELETKCMSFKQTSLLDGLILPTRNLFFIHTGLTKKYEYVFDEHVYSSLCSFNGNPCPSLYEKILELDIDCVGICGTPMSNIEKTAIRSVGEHCLDTCVIENACCGKNKKTVISNLETINVGEKYITITLTSDEFEKRFKNIE